MTHTMTDPAGFEAAVAEADEFCRGLRGAPGTLLILLSQAGRSVGATVNIADIQHLGDQAPCSANRFIMLIKDYLQIRGLPAGVNNAWSSPHNPVFAFIIGAVAKHWMEHGLVPNIVMCVSENGSYWPYMSAIPVAVKATG